MARGDFFQKMDTLKVSNRSISVSPCKRFLLLLVLLVYDHRLPQIIPQSIPRYQNHRKPIYMEQHPQS